MAEQLRLSAGSGAERAVKALTVELEFWPYRHVVEADIKGHFDTPMGTEFLSIGASERVY
jgi:hypothetical protein